LLLVTNTIQGPLLAAAAFLGSYSGDLWVTFPPFSLTVFKISNLFYLFSLKKKKNDPSRRQFPVFA